MINIILYYRQIHKSNISERGYKIYFIQQNYIVDMESFILYNLEN